MAAHTHIEIKHTVLMTAYLKLPWSVYLTTTAFISMKYVCVLSRYVRFNSV